MDENELKFYGDWLMCPLCGGENMHHERVQLFVRDAEDRDGMLVTVGATGDIDGRKYTPQGMVLNRMASKEMPGRRDAIHIHFWCEQCEGKSVLHIAQHKGLTLVSWTQRV